MERIWKHSCFPVSFLQGIYHEWAVDVTVFLKRWWLWIVLLAKCMCGTDFIHYSLFTWVVYEGIFLLTFWETSSLNCSFLITRGNHFLSYFVSWLEFIVILFFPVQWTNFIGIYSQWLSFLMGLQSQMTRHWAASSRSCVVLWDSQRTVSVYY